MSGGTIGSATFPAIGHVFEANFGQMAFQLDFVADGRAMTFTGADGAPTTIQYTAVDVGPQVFMVYWIEPNGTTVTHVEDFGKGVVHTNITMPDLSFINLSGTLKKLR